MAVHDQGAERRFARLVDEGKLHPDDVATLRMAARAGRTLYMHADGRLRLVPERRGRPSEPGETPSIFESNR